MRVIICGGRDFVDMLFAYKTLDRLQKEHGITHVIEGGQRTRDKVTREILGGADYWGMRWAKRQELSFNTVRADWSLHGKAAGPIRNQHMLDEYNPDLVIAFPGGNGTADMIKKSKRAGVKVIEITKEDYESYCAKMGRV